MTRPNPPIGGVSVTRGTCEDTGTHMTADAAAPGVDTDDTLSATDPRRDSRAGPYSSSRLSMAPPPVAGQLTQTAAPVVTYMAAPLPLHMTRDLGTDDTTTAASVIDVGVDTDADPSPATTGLLTDAHVSSFLRHIRRRADDKVAGLVLDAAPPDTGHWCGCGPGSCCRRPWGRRWPHHRHGCRHCRWFTPWRCRRRSSLRLGWCGRGHDGDT